MKLSGLNIFREYAKNFKLNLILVVVFVSESKAHLYRLYFEAIQFFHSFWWDKLYNHLLDDHASHDKKNDERDRIEIHYTRYSQSHERRRSSEEEI